MREYHPIQLHEITVAKLSVVVNDNEAANDFEGELSLETLTGVSDLSPDDPQFAVGMKAEVKPKIVEGQELAFVINVELSGQFRIDYSKFSFDDLGRWCEVNAPFILLPYLREQIYGIALRAGIRKMVIPLFVSRPAAPQRTEQ